MSSFVDWLQHDTAGLLTLAAVSIAVLLVLIIKIKLEPFIALIVVSVAVALARRHLGERVGRHADEPRPIPLLEKGFGGILGHIALIIGSRHRARRLPGTLRRRGRADHAAAEPFRAQGRPAGDGS